MSRAFRWAYQGFVVKRDDETTFPRKTGVFMSLRDLLTPKLVELGAVRIGTLGEERTSRAGGKWRAPMKLDHFIITQNTVRDSNGQLIRDDSLESRLKEEFKDADGALRQIPISLLSDDVEASLKCAYVHYRGKKLWARSDGVTLTSFFNFKDQTPLAEPTEVPWKDDFLDLRFNNAPMFKKHTKLEFVIRMPEARWGGVYRFRTTSVITADQLYGSLLHLQRLTSGVITGMPLMLVVRPMIVHPDGKPTTVHVVHVELRGNDLTDLQTRALDLARFHRAHKVEMAALQRELGTLVSDPGLDEDDDEQADIQQEFHPEGGAVGNGGESAQSESISGLVNRVAGAKTEAVAEEPKTPDVPPETKPVEQEKVVQKPVADVPAKTDENLPDDRRRFEKKPPAHPEMFGEPEQKPATPKAEPQSTAGVDLDKMPEVKKMLQYLPDVKTLAGITMKRNQWAKLSEVESNKAAETLVLDAIAKREEEIKAKA